MARFQTNGLGGNTWVKHRSQHVWWSPSRGRPFRGRGQHLTPPSAGLPHAADAERLAALATYDILDTEPEQGFEDLTLLASRICDTQVALVSMVDRDHQWFTPGR
jgi:hypothetical protein